MRPSPSVRFKPVSKPSVAFLSTPAAIRQALVRALSSASHVDIAVAFLGEDWWNLLGTLSVPIRVVCWLRSTNTNPYAVEQMMNTDGFSVRQLDRMHAKVYLARGNEPVAVVGSANISGAALASDGAVGQYEAAVVSSAPSVLLAARQWFEGIWRDASAISSVDLDAAKAAWDAAHIHGRGRGSRSTAFVEAEFLPGDWTPPTELLALAATVAPMDLINGSQFGDEWEFVGDLDPASMTRDDVERIFEHLVRWAGHPGVFRPFTHQALSAVRAAFSCVFDEGLEVGERLLRVAPKGDAKLPGLGLASWTILLQWRLPALYPPFDRRTLYFLRAFELDHFVPRVLTPAGYSRWCAFARELSGRLSLPTPGHVDRMVWEYTKDKEIA